MSKVMGWMMGVFGVGQVHADMCRSADASMTHSHVQCQQVLKKTVSGVGKTRQEEGRVPYACWHSTFT